MLARSHHGRRRTTLAAVVALGTLPLHPAVAGAAEAQVVAGSFRVRFTGTSTLHDFEGTVLPRPVRVHRIGETGTWHAIVAVPVAAMDTGNDWRDAKLRATLDSEHYPEITAIFDAIDPARARPPAGAATGSLPFLLRVREMSRPLVGTTANWDEGPGRVAFDVWFGVSLAAFALEAPSTLGVMRVGDEVRVTVHVELAATT